MAARLSAQKVSDVAAGDYSAADDVNFTLIPYGDKYLLRFDGNPENFVLYGDRIALGGRELKYDTGAIALKISVWGGVTLYTQDAPGGLPATRTGDAALPPKLAVPVASLATALSDEESHLSYTQHLKLHFSADAAVVKGGDDARAYAFDTLVNSEIGIEHCHRHAGGTGRLHPALRSGAHCGRRQAHHCDFWSHLAGELCAVFRRGGPRFLPRDRLRAGKAAGFAGTSLV